jgi:hypothetical protein
MPIAIVSNYFPDTLLAEYAGFLGRLGHLSCKSVIFPVEASAKA